MTAIRRLKVADRLRFDVFKRDQFTCQYCGRKAPDVVLNADHIHPVAAGGNDSLMNLVTSCRDCNSGKSDRLLSDNAAVVKARTQAEDIEERRQQITMMAAWQVELSQMAPEIEALNTALMVVADRQITEVGKKSMRKLLREFSVQEIIEAMAIAFDQYPADQAMGRIGGVATNIKLRKEDPDQALMQKVLNALSYKLRGPAWKKQEARRVLLGLRESGGAWLACSRRAEAISRTWDQYIDEIKR